MFIKLTLLFISCIFSVIWFLHKHRNKNKIYTNKVIKKIIIKVNANHSYLLKMNTAFWIVPVNNVYATSNNIYGIKENEHVQFFDKTCKAVFAKSDTVQILNYFSDKQQFFYCFYIEQNI